jgi:hypothetical protein
MEIFDLVPFITFGMLKHRQEENVVPVPKQEYYGTGVHLIPVKVLPWEEYIIRTTGI